MRVLLQRVKGARIVIDEQETREIGPGIFLLVGMREGDDLSDAEVEKMAQKCAELRIFEDENEKMNLSAKELGYDALVVSNFTLFADTKKGRRPSFIAAARPEFANEGYQKFLSAMRRQGLNKVASGEFGAYMQITPLCDGPVTVLLDSDEWKKKGEQ